MDATPLDSKAEPADVRATLDGIRTLKRR